MIWIQIDGLQGPPCFIPKEVPAVVIPCTWLIIPKVPHTFALRGVSSKWVLQTHKSCKPKLIAPNPQQNVKKNTEVISNTLWNIKTNRHWPYLPRLNSFWNTENNMHCSPLGSHLPGLCIRTESQNCQTSHWHNDRNANRRTKEATHRKKSL